MTHTPTAMQQRLALEALEVRIATVRDLARGLELSMTDPFDQTVLNQLATAVYARAVVWFGEDPAVLAENAREMHLDEQRDTDGQMIELDDVEETEAPADDVATMLAFLEHHGDRPTTHDHDQARELCLTILACLMHAEYAAHDTERKVYGAHVPLMF